MKTLLKYKSLYLKVQLKCLVGVDALKFPGPCPPPESSGASLKFDALKQKAHDRLAASCVFPDDLAALGFHTGPADCHYGPPDSAAETTCDGLPDATNAGGLYDCLVCWKRAELAEHVAILFAAHAVDTCEGTLDASSTECSKLDCTSPLPDQRNLGDPSLGDTQESDCQRVLGKVGIKHLLAREKILEKCALNGFTQADCLSPTLFGPKLMALEEKTRVSIQKGCGVRDPDPHPPFCCRTGTGDACTAASTREECVDPMGLNGQVQDHKTCQSGTCAAVTGHKNITWWGVCPEDSSGTCTTTLSTQDDLIDCVNSSTDKIADRLVCLQFPRNGGADWPCP